VIVLLCVFVAFQLFYWCCKQGTALGRERVCRLATAIILGILSALYAAFALGLTGYNVAKGFGDWTCFAFAVVAMTSVIEPILVYVLVPPATYIPANTWADP
jgi:hypothetical protein